MFCCTQAVKSWQLPLNAAQMFALVQQAGSCLRAPLLLFAYHSQVLAGGGPDRFCRKASQAGAAGEPSGDALRWVVPHHAFLPDTRLHTSSTNGSCVIAAHLPCTNSRFDSSMFVPQACWSPTFQRSSCLSCSAQRQHTA